MDSFETYRPLMFSIAYRMLGSAMEAEDVVQEAFLRSREAGEVQYPKAYLSTIVTRLCLDQLKAARSQRETYVGPWLPEPVLTNGGSLGEPSEKTETTETISMAFLVLLENLTPAERAVFLLREVFDYDYGEIAGILGKEESACRQLFSRAKKHVNEHRPRFKSTPEEHTRLFNSFLTAINAGDLEGLTSLLAEDITLWSDGGGKVTAARHPLHGVDTVARFLLGLMRLKTDAMTFEITEVNGSSALIIRDGGQLNGVMTLDVGDGRVRGVRFVVNPDKLKKV
jgi:RNA polymerase sigma-70 factor (ECF subfamily)